MAAQEGVLVQEVMSKRPIFIKEEDTLPFIISIFERTRISGAPVVNVKGDYVGVISKTDLVGNKLLDFAGSLDKATARDFMSAVQPLSVAQDEPIENVVSMMLQNQVHRVFVHDSHHKLIGVVSSFDILKILNDMLGGAQAGLMKPAESAKNGKGEKAVKEKDKESEKEKDLERRIFNLISMKQEQMSTPPSR